MIWRWSDASQADDYAIQDTGNTKQGQRRCSPGLPQLPDSERLQSATKTTEYIWFWIAGLMLPPYIYLRAANEVGWKRFTKRGVLVFFLIVPVFIAMPYMHQGFSAIGIPLPFPSVYFVVHIAIFFISMADVARYYKLDKLEIDVREAWHGK